MGMGKRGDGIDVGDIRVGVAKGLEIDERSLRTDRRLDLGQIVDIHERGLDPKIGEGVGQQVVCAAVDGLLGNHVSPGASKRLDGEGDRCRARRNRKRRHSTFECGDAILQYTLGGVGQAPVDVAGVGQPKAVGGMLGIAEHVTRRLINWDGAGVGRGVGTLLSDMQLQGVEAKLVVGVLSKTTHNVLLGFSAKNYSSQSHSQVRHCFPFFPI